MHLQACQACLVGVMDRIAWKGPLPATCLYLVWFESWDFCLIQFACVCCLGARPTKLVAWAHDWAACYLITLQPTFLYFKTTGNLMSQTQPGCCIQSSRVLGLQPNICWILRHALSGNLPSNSRQLPGRWEIQAKIPGLHPNMPSCWWHLNYEPCCPNWSSYCWSCNYIAAHK